MHICIIPEVSYHAFILNVRHAFPYLEAKNTVSTWYSKGHTTSKGHVPMWMHNLQNKISPVKAGPMKSGYKHGKGISYFLIWAGYNTRNFKYENNFVRVLRWAWLFSLFSFLYFIFNSFDVITFNNIFFLSNGIS